jgi:antitoxin CptB
MRRDNKINEVKETNISWACRRGMLELDVLLSNFYKEVYPNLTVEHKAGFIELLKRSDPELFDWLLGRQRPEKEDLAIITEMIRNHAKSRI